MKQVIPFSNNLSSFDLRMIRNLAKKGWDEDISTSTKNLSEPLVVLAKFASRELSVLYKHCFFGFVILVPCDYEVQLLEDFEDTNVTFIRQDRPMSVVLSSASLQTWVSLVKHLSTVNTDPQILVIVNQIQEYFEQQDLSFLFKGLIKKSQKSGYILE